ncbi:hypothetical protein B0H10DRAFT_1973767 [Mycena sp. CBHHK59/15]|nr:hypothetical protein B0H10DRAFT_1973767 [Mycena sp. CBHHK59/15]
MGRSTVIEDVERAINRCEDNELDAMLDNGLTVIAAHVWVGVADPVGTTRTDAAGPVGTASARLKGYRGDEATSRAFQNISKRPQWTAVDGLRPAWEVSDVRRQVGKREKRIFEPTRTYSEPIPVFGDGKKDGRAGIRTSYILDYQRTRAARDIQKFGGTLYDTRALLDPLLKIVGILGSGLLSGVLRIGTQV